MTQDLGSRLPDLLRFAVALCGDGAVAQGLLAQALQRAAAEPGADDPETVVTLTRVWIVRGFLSEGMRLDAPAAADVDRPVPAEPDAPHDLDARFGRLSKLGRTVVVLRYGGGLPVRDIARTVGSTVEGIGRFLPDQLARLGMVVPPAPADRLGPEAAALAELVGRSGALLPAEENDGPVALTPEERRSEQQQNGAADWAGRIGSVLDLSGPDDEVTEPGFLGSADPAGSSAGAAAADAHRAAVPQLPSPGTSTHVALLERHVPGDALLDLSGVDANPTVAVAAARNEEDSDVDDTAFHEIVGSRPRDASVEALDGPGASPVRNDAPTADDSGGPRLPRATIGRAGAGQPKPAPAAEGAGVQRVLLVLALVVVLAAAVLIGILATHQPATRNAPRTRHAAPRVPRTQPIGH